MNACPDRDLGDVTAARSANDLSGRVSMAGTPRYRSTSRALRIRLSRRSHAKARTSPMTRPTASPLGTTIFLSGAVGLLPAGGTALVMMDPPELPAASEVNAATWLDSWLISLLSALSTVCALARLAESLGRDAIVELSPEAVFSSPAIFDCRTPSWALIDWADWVSRFCRYALANASAQVAATPGLAPVQWICRTWELGGTVTVTWLASVAGDSGLCSIFAAIWATCADWTTTASVSRLTVAPLVRLFANALP